MIPDCLLEDVRTYADSSIFASHDHGIQDPAKTISGVQFYSDFPAYCPITLEAEIYEGTWKSISSSAENDWITWDSTNEIFILSTLSTNVKIDNEYKLRITANMAKANEQRRKEITVTVKPPVCSLETITAGVASVTSIVHEVTTDA